MSFLKKAKLLPILGIAAMAIGGLVACNKHEHTFSDEWSHSETLHWHEATCDHVDEKRDLDAHVFDNACDPDCNVCGYTRTPAQHIYLNDCDESCEVCGHTRTVSDHVYSDDCDTTCNECGHERTVDGHVYDNDCDATCNKCGNARVVGEHVYDNDCDTTCNECGHERQVHGHVYLNDCDTTCEICGHTRTVGAHVYTDDCDTTCNECGHVREVTGHTYDNDCDPTCNTCGDVRVVPGHVYDHDHDPECNVCGHTRTVGAHIYTDDCDTTCEVCGHTRTVGEHSYDNDCDDECNECGHMREVEHKWSLDYQYDEDGEGHWHYCTVCDTVGPLESCVFDQEVAEDKYLHTAATNSTKAVYYYSCVCGRASETLTFELEKLASGIGYFNRSKNYDGLPAKIDYRVKSDGEVIAEFKKIGESEDKYTTVVPKDAAVYDVRVTVKETPIYRGATVNGFYTINPLNIEVDLSDYDLVVTQDSNEPAIVTLDDTVTGILPGETADVSVLPADDSTVGAQDLTIDKIESLNTNYVVTATSDTAKFIVRSAGATYFTVTSAFLDTGSNNFRIHGNVTGGDLVIGDKLELPGLDLVIEVETLRRSGNADAGGIVQSGNGANVILNAATMDADYLALLEENIRAGKVFTVNNEIEFQDTYLATFYIKTSAEGGRTTPIAWPDYVPKYKLNDYTNRYAIIKAAYGTDQDNGLIFPGETVTLLIQFVNNLEDKTPMKTIIKPGINAIEMVEVIEGGDNRVTAVGTISYNTDVKETSFVEVGYGLVSDATTGDGYTYLVDLTDAAAVSKFYFFSTENGLNNGSTQFTIITNKFSVIIYEVTATGLVEVPGVLQSNGTFIKDGESSAFLFENGRQFVVHIDMLADVTSFCFGMV